ncbi:acetylornithine deacetylase (plasmid) [Rhizobium sp. NIBRBAC000502774]|nr:acetylornithine deacetylase [Rhizobium sp. NIBRBAC000502774]
MTPSMTPVSIRTLDILEALVAMDTTSHRSNMACVDWIARYLQGYGIETSLIFGDTREKANIFATIGPQDCGGIILSGHMDVVPALADGWRSDPFCMRKTDERVYGRGTCDMKGFLAVVLAAVPEMVSRPLRCPFHLAFSFDEELGCRGVPYLIDALPTGDRRPKVALVGEPTQWQLVDRHKGSYVVSTTVRGKAAHSSRPELGVNAISIAARIIDRIGELAAEMQNANVEAGLKTVFNVGKISGGSADNIVAETCTFVWGFRTFDDDAEDIIARVRGYTEQMVVPRMREISPITGVDFVVEREILALNRNEAGSGFAKMLGHCVEVDGEPVYAGYGTEAGHFAKAGIPAIVCGPGDIAQAHQPDEWLAIEQLLKGDRVMTNLIAWARSHAGDELLDKDRSHENDVI